MLPRLQQQRRVARLFINGSRYEEILRSQRAGSLSSMKRKLRIPRGTKKQGNQQCPAHAKITRSFKEPEADHRYR
jgi:hypothetical protein